MDKLKQKRLDEYAEKKKKSMCVYGHVCMCTCVHVCEESSLSFNVLHQPCPPINFPLVIILFYCFNVSIAWCFFQLLHPFCLLLLLLLFFFFSFSPLSLEPGPIAKSNIILEVKPWGDDVGKSLPAPL